MSRALLTLALMLASAPAAAAPSLHPMFQDHAVLQRDQPIPVYGSAEPGEALQISLNGATARGRADGRGRWRVDLPAQKAGGPYVLSVLGDGGAKIEASDVLVGDVYLCSGQSNMEWPVRAANNGGAEAANSANPRIRHMRIPQVYASIPADAFGERVSWAIAGPETTGAFSAACYFMVRELQKTVDTPFGLVHASWGGSAIQAWMSAEGLAKVGSDRERHDILRRYVADPADGAAAFGRQWEAWWSQREQSRPWAADYRADASWGPVPVMDAWERWGVPEMAVFNGVVLFRTTVTLTPEQAGKGATLSLGQADESDLTWVNGRAVGASGSGDRLYRLPAGLLKAGENTVAVAVLDTWGVGGIYGPAEKRALVFDDGSRAALDQQWLWRAVPATYNRPPRAPWEATQGVTTLYNGMIAPIGPYGFKGVAWYQGESNTEDGVAGYLGRMQALMADWRRRFERDDLAWLVVQLANFNPPESKPVESGWAEVREAQRLAVLQDRRAGLAVAVDIGDRYDIHPTNKQEVGRRLARAARSAVYGEAIAPSGPMATSAARSGEHVVVTFDDVEGGLVTYSGQALGFELCGAGRGDCRFVPGVASGSQVTLSAPAGLAPTRVRFCWADNPVCNLSDGSKLPASPFELPIR
jgi:sialate O-acetylesterase